MGVPVSPTSFLRLQKALSIGLINSIDDFYTAARAILVKSERYFDTYDQVFAHHFKGAELKEPDAYELSEIAQTMLSEWLKNPKELADALGIDENELFYLQVRGIPLVEAERLIVEGFFAEVIEQIPDEMTRNRLGERLSKKFEAS